MAVPALADIPCLLVVVGSKMGTDVGSCRGGPFQAIGLDGGLDLSSQGPGAAAAMGRVAPEGGPSVHELDGAWRKPVRSGPARRGRGRGALLFEKSEHGVDLRVGPHGW